MWGQHLNVNLAFNHYNNPKWFLSSAWWTGLRDDISFPHVRWYNNSAWWTFIARWVEQRECLALATLSNLLCLTWYILKISH